MTENTITLSDTATKIVRADVRAFKADGKRYADYIAEMNVTLDTVAEHVALFRSEFKAMTKSATPEQVKAYATKVRNGLNYNLGKQSGTADAPVYLLTAQGVKSASDLSDEDLIAAVRAEAAARTSE
jgi:hypothetical protein